MATFQRGDRVRDRLTGRTGLVMQFEADVFTWRSRVSTVDPTLSFRIGEAAVEVKWDDEPGLHWFPARKLERC